MTITAHTHPETYAALGVPELWQTIRIYQLQAGQSVEVADSPTFPGWALQAEIPEYVRQSQVKGRNRAMRSFRQWGKSRLQCS
ncbi:MAG: hypothetical protein AAFV72_05785 [Cyanobacteria bacterium J06635_1]